MLSVAEESRSSDDEQDPDPNSQSKKLDPDPNKVKSRIQTD
jgi:hypothetical protein